MNDSYKQHLIESFEKNIRFDGRKNEDFRKVKVETGISKTAEGSARVTFGDTEVIAGIKIFLGAPFPDRPDEGAIMVNAEFLQMASPRFEGGPPGINAIELSRVVDRGIRESKAMDLKKLCLKKGEKVWVVSIDICIVNDAGNLQDASALAAIAALKDTTFPEYDGEKIDYKKKTDKKLPLTKEPVSTTICKIGKKLFLDPTDEEFENVDSRLTVAITEDGTICALQKGGNYPLTIEEISKMIDLASQTSKKLRKHLQ